MPNAIMEKIYTTSENTKIHYRLDHSTNTSFRIYKQHRVTEAFQVTAMFF